jgi:glycerol uptake facilitator-like aquaporin
VVLIAVFGPISGAHFNPAVSLVFTLRRELPARDTAFYVAAQIIGGIVGTFVAHLMFAVPLMEVSIKIRMGARNGLRKGWRRLGLSP